MTVRVRALLWLAISVALVLISSGQAVGQVAGADDDEPRLGVSPADLRPRRVVNLTKGMQFRPPFTALAVSSTNPNVAYLGTRSGRIFATHDGGLRWEETKALVARASFVGSIRPSSSGRLATDVVEPTSSFFKPSEVLRHLEDVERSASDGDGRFGLLGPQKLVIDLFDKGLAPGAPMASGGEGGAGSKLGVGLRAGSPYLTLALRQTSGWAMGINIKQTLSLVGAPPTAITWLSINPEDNDDVMAATRDGLLRTTDGGYSWNLVLTGSTPRERWMNHVVRNPHDSRQVFVGSTVGLLVSDDGGESFARITDARLATFDVLFTVFHPTNPDVFFVGTASGVFRTTNGGRDFQWVFVRPWPPQNKIRKIAIDPANPRRVLIGTEDGLFASADAGDTWERVGGLLFTGETIRALSASGRPGHFMVGTPQDLWETFDGGTTWQVLYFGRIEWDVMFAFFAPGKPDKIWLITWGEILQIDRSAPPPMSSKQVAAYKALVASEPRLNEVVHAALVNTGVDRTELAAYRARARYAGLLPRIQAGLVWRDLASEADRHSRNLAGTALGEPPLVAGRAATIASLGYTVAGTWDLAELVISTDKVPIDRYFHANRSAEWRVRQTTIVSYIERRRLQLEDLLDKSPDPRTQLMRRMRIEELTVHLNFFAGEVFRVVEAL